MKAKRIIKTIIATMILLIAFFVQGAVVVMGQIEGVNAALIPGSIIWVLVIMTICYYAIKYRGLSKLRFSKMEKGTGKGLLYFIPLLAIAFSHFTAGFVSEMDIRLFLAKLFFTLAIGMAEEIYFRGIILNIWLEKGIVKGMLISSVLFGLCHLLNIAGGASIEATVLQICFAFVYGMVFALIFAIGKSIVPCILLHALHDFCSFISADVSLKFNVILGSIQFVTLIVYFIYLLWKTFCKDKRTQLTE